MFVSHPQIAYLKHYTAYSRETDRGHDSYQISPHDFFETYLAQYEIAFVEGGAAGAMCSYNAENGVPSCANNFILNQVCACFVSPLVPTPYSSLVMLGPIGMTSRE